MTKINQEEYEVLKALDDKWEWIARDENSDLVAYTSVPYKSKYRQYWVPQTAWEEQYFDEDMFQFIQWEDSEPYNIAELIEEYEKDYKGSWEHAIEFSKEIRRESEETEVKKDIEWLISEIDQRVEAHKETTPYNTGVATGMRSSLFLINQLDEAEVLSQEWIDKHSYNVHLLGTPDVETVAIPREDLQNLLVPKQEEIKVSKMWHDVIAQNKEEGHSLRWTLNYIDNLNVNDVDDFARAWLAYPNIEIEEEPKYYVLDKENATLLKKSAVGEGIAKSVGTNIYNAKSWKNEEEYQLTEQEIKDYDERYWSFAVKVEELEE